MKTLSYLGLSLVALSAALACSSSSSSGETPDASSPDGHTQPQPDAAIGADSSTATDSAPPHDASTSDSPTSADAGTALSFSTDIYGPIIQAHCIFCHGPTADGGDGTGESFGGLDMSSVDAGYANLVSVAAQGEACAHVDGGAGPVRVVPGNASASLLYLKVDGFTVTPPCGSPMPKSGEIPDGGQAIMVEQIQTWIDQGARP